jgi:hypothetical protein
VRLSIEGVLTTRRASSRSQAWTALLGLSTCIGSGAVAAHFYPGGTYWDRQSTGFDLTNFWCDLLRPIALGGAENSVGTRAAQVALLALALGLGPFFSLAAEELGLAGFRRLVATTGAWGGRIALILVAAGTGRLPSAVHDWAILLGAPLGLVTLCLVVIDSSRLARWLPLLGGAGLALGLWNLLQYAREALLHAPAWPGLPLVQKAATLGVLAFLTLFLVQALRRDARERERSPERG